MIPIMMTRIIKTEATIPAARDVLLSILVVESERKNIKCKLESLIFV